MSGDQSVLSIASDKDNALLVTLADLTHANLEALIRRAKDTLSNGDHSREIVMLEAMYSIASFCRAARTSQIFVSAFADNDAAKWGTTIDGVPNMSHAEAVGRFNDISAFAIDVFNGFAPKAQLAAMVCRRVVSYHDFAWTFPRQYDFHTPHFVAT